MTDFTTLSIAELEQAVSTSSDNLRKSRVCLELARKLKDFNADASVDYANKAIRYAVNGKSKTDEGTALLFLGQKEYAESRYNKALELWYEAHQCFLFDHNTAMLAQSHSQLGAIYNILGNNEDALKHNLQALKGFEDLNDSKGIARVVHNIGNIYYHINDFKNAEEYYLKAMEINKSLGVLSMLSKNKFMFAALYQKQDLFDKSLMYYESAREDTKACNDLAGMLQCDGSIASLLYEKGDFDAALVKALDTLHQCELIDETVGMVSCAMTLGKIYLKQKKYEQAYHYIRVILHGAEKVNVIRFRKVALTLLVTYYEEQNLWEKALRHYRECIAIEQQINSQEVVRQMSNLDGMRALDKKEAERAATEKILHNILPKQIAERILQGEKQIADHCEIVSVFFSDIVGFTKLSEHKTPAELVGMLNELFTEFDRIAIRHGLEKIKTIGDAYMAVAGVPVPQENHAERAALFALDVMQWMCDYRTRTGNDLQIRAGLHCGHAVAGVIGENKFAYDLWGDTVNTASRMESHGVEDKIQVSEEFKNHLTPNPSPKERGETAAFTFEERGEIEVKGKGKMKTYFLMKDYTA